MLPLAVFCFFFNVLVGATQCTGVQLGTPCQYETTDCLKGSLQWNYPTKTCQWIFAPQGASQLQLSAFWATASYVNLTFYDNTDLTKAKTLAVVNGGDSDEQTVNVTSSTGVVYVRLSGPPSMMTYALIFDYTISAKVEQCSYNNCEQCLAVGCSMTGPGKCVPTCPMDASCWSSLHSTPAAVCASRQQALGTTADGNVCSTQTTCQACIEAGCSVLGLSGLQCVGMCPTDIPCFSSASSTSAAAVCDGRRTQAEKDALCKSKSACGDCAAANCVWNSLAAPGDECIAGCGFFPCQLRPECSSVGGLKVGATKSQAFETTTGSLLLLLISGLLW